MRLVLALLAVCTVVQSTPLIKHIRNVTIAARQNELVSRAAGDFYLRIMPLGASITKGDPSAPGKSLPQILKTGRTDML
jgi:hypothetical protein